MNFLSSCELYSRAYDDDADQHGNEPAQMEGFVVHLRHGFLIHAPRLGRKYRPNHALKGQHAANGDGYDSAKAHLTGYLRLGPF